MRLKYLAAVTILVTVLATGSCWADIVSVSGTGFSGGPSQAVNFVSYGGNFPASVITDTMSALTSSATFNYAAPPDCCGNLDRMILLLTNSTGSNFSSITFTLSGATFYTHVDLPNVGTYAPGTPPTFTNGTSYTPSSGTTFTLNTPLANGATEYIYFAIADNSSGSGSFTLTQTANGVSAIEAPEPSSLLLIGTGIAGLAGTIRRKLRK